MNKSDRIVVATATFATVFVILLVILADLASRQPTIHAQDKPAVGRDYGIFWIEKDAIVMVYLDPRGLQSDVNGDLVLARGMKEIAKDWHVDPDSLKTSTRYMGKWEYPTTTSWTFRVMAKQPVAVNEQAGE